MAKILVVDDEMGIRELLSEILEDENHEVVLAANASAARAHYANTALDLMLLDIWMPDTDGMTLLREWVAAGALRCPVVMMSGHASIDTALEANELGAAGFLEKPITLQRLLSTVHKILTRSKPFVNKEPAAPNQNYLPHHSTSSGNLSTAQSSPGHTANDTVTMLGTNSTDTASSLAQEQARQIQPSSTFNPLTNSHLSTAFLETSNAHYAANSTDPWRMALEQVSLNTSLREFREQTERIYFEYLLETTRAYALERLAEVPGLTIHGPREAARRGGIVREVYVQEGDEVKKGQILARQEDDEPKLSAARARAQLAQTRAQLANTLRAVVCQTRFTRADDPGASLVVCEVMVVTYPDGVLPGAGEGA